MKKDIEKTIKEISQLTDDNMHSEALLELAIYTSNKKLVSAALAVVKLHEYFGQLTPSLKNIRDDIYNSCMALLTINEQTQIKKAF